MDNGVPPTSKRVASRPAGSATKSRAAQPGDPRKEAATGGQPRPGQGRNGQGNGAGANGSGNGSGTRQPQRTSKRRSVSNAPIDPLLPQPDHTDGAYRPATADDSGALPLLTIARPVAPEVGDTDTDTTGTTDTTTDTDTDTGARAKTGDTDVKHAADQGVAAQPTGTRGHGPTAPAVAGALASLVVQPADRSPLLLPPIVPAEPEHTSPAAEPTTTTEAMPAPAPFPELTPTVQPDTGDTTDTGAGIPSDTDGTDGLPSLLRPTKPARALRAPKVMPRVRPRVRRVTRVVRHVDTWSVFKVALVFNLFIYAVCLTAGVLLWRVAVSTGTVDNIERFFESFGWQHFELKAGEIYHNAWVAGLFLVVGFTGLAVLMATMFNLITDLVGGIRISVLEEEVVVRAERATGWRRARRHQPFPPPRPLPREPKARRGAKVAAEDAEPA